MKKQTPHTIILFFLAGIFFILYNLLNFSTPRLFNSPDETMHHAFIKQFAQTNQFIFPHTHDYGDFARFVFPRSTYGVGPVIVPVGFWGLNVVYGFLAKIVGVSFVVFLTSILVIIGVFCWYSLIRHLFHRSVAFISSVLFLCQPVLWYYTERSLFPNVPFLMFLIIGLWFLIVRPLFSKRKTASLLNELFGSIVFFTAILIRPSEVLWLGVGTAIVLFAYRKKVDWTRFGIFAAVGFLFLCLYVLVNGVLFRGHLISYAASQSAVLPHWYSVVFPFGIDISQIIKAKYVYLFQLVWWYTVPAGIGILIFLNQWKHRMLPKKQRVYGAVFFCMAFFLLVLYGSFHDARFSLHTIGISYTRYWLPISIGLLPFAALCLLRLQEFFHRAWQKQLVGAWILFLVFLLSARAVFLGDDGIIKTGENIAHGAEIKTWTLAEIPENAIVVTDTEDKFFWPERQVMVNIKNGDIRMGIHGLLKKRYPLYFFTPRLEDNTMKELQELLRTSSLELEKIMEFPPHEMYRIKIAL